LNKPRIFLEVNKQRNGKLIPVLVLKTLTLMTENPHSKSMSSTDVSVTYHIPAIEQHQKALTLV
jgi:hypothetical protein